MQEQSPIAERNTRILFITASGHHPAIIANALGEAFVALDVLVEQPESRLAFLRRRVRLNGLVSTIGQFITMTMIVFVKRLRRSRMEKLIEKLGVRTSFDAVHRIHHVSSVNDVEFRLLTETLKPDLIFLCGCRIVSPEILRKIKVPVLNYHAGVTPAYRGMNGGYWALANGDAENFGTTVHLVDTGVDTGGVLGHAKLSPQAGDTIWSYAYGQAAGSRQLCIESVKRVACGDIQTVRTDGQSRQWFHPTVWQYLATGWRTGVW